MPLYYIIRQDTLLLCLDPLYCCRQLSLPIENLLRPLRLLQLKPINTECIVNHRVMIDGQSYTHKAAVSRLRKRKWKEALLRSLNKLDKDTRVFMNDHDRVGYCLPLIRPLYFLFLV